MKELTLSATNEYGQKFINTWTSSPIISIYCEYQSNWFFAVSEDGKVYSLPYKWESCKPSYFGNSDYLNNYIKTTGRILISVSNIAEVEAFKPAI